MYYQIANTATLESIESSLNATFRYRDLYTTRREINGLIESNIEIITTEHPTQVSFAIWGMIPVKFEDDWEDFQQITNTLTIRVDQWKDNLWYSSAVENRRCIIISTGFYTYAIREGQVHRYFVKHASEDLLLFGGIYNQLEDGFLTCSILTKKANDEIKLIQNSVDTMPLIIDKKDVKTWLNEETSEISIDKLIGDYSSAPLSVTPINTVPTYDFSGRKER